MSKKACHFRLSSESQKALAVIAKHYDLQPTASVEMALQRFAETVSTGDQWVGRGNWYGWRITSSHAKGTRWEPVLVSPDGYTMTPDDLL